MHVCTHTYIRTSVRTYVRTDRQTDIRTYLRTYVRTYIHNTRFILCRSFCATKRFGSWIRFCDMFMMDFVGCFPVVRWWPWKEAFGGTGEIPSFLGDWRLAHIAEANWFFGPILGKSNMYGNFEWFAHNKVLFGLDNIMMIDGGKSFEHSVKPFTGACALLTLAMVESFHGRQLLL